MVAVVRKARATHAGPLALLVWRWFDVWSRGPALQGQPLPVLKLRQGGEDVIVPSAVVFEGATAVLEWLTRDQVEE